LGRLNIQPPYKSICRGGWSAAPINSAFVETPW
jgi:hypothetical protein